MNHRTNQDALMKQIENTNYYITENGEIFKKLKVHQRGNVPSYKLTKRDGTQFWTPKEELIRRYT